MIINLFLSIILFIVLWVSDQLLISSLGIAITVFLVTQLISKAGKMIPILDLISAFASIQWILGAWLSYQLYGGELKFMMAVSEQEYMGWAVPGVIAFHLGLQVFAKNNTQHWKEYLAPARQLIIEKPKVPLILVGIGLMGMILQPMVPGPLRFIFYLLSALQYIGIILLLFSPSKYARWVIIGILSSTFLRGVSSSLIHDLILWMTFFGFYFLYRYPFTTRWKYTILIAGSVGLFTIQSVKYEYRSLTWFGGYSGSRLDLLSDLIVEKVNQGQLFAIETVSRVILRINQGAINSRVMYYVPAFQDYAAGQTVETAISAALLPRFLAPNKAKAGGRENYEKYTGIKLQRGTSMGISLLSEGYVNYGKAGTPAFLFLIGAFFSICLRVLLRQIKTFPLLSFFLPLIFFQVVKAETELVVVLNHLVKGIIFTFLFLFLANRIGNWKLFRQ